eukprot:3537537-Rhodomonas_salina.2
MPGTDIGRCRLCAYAPPMRCYAISGTDIAYASMLVLSDVRSAIGYTATRLLCNVSLTYSTISLRACYEMSGTDSAIHIRACNFLSGTDAAYDATSRSLIELDDNITFAPVKVASYEPTRLLCDARY